MPKTPLRRAVAALEGSSRFVWPPVQSIEALGDHQLELIPGHREEHRDPLVPHEEFGSSGLRESEDEDGRFGGWHGSGHSMKVA